MKHFLQAVTVSAFLALASTFAATGAYAAQALNTAKATCDIGEQINGYLGRVPGGHASTAAVAEMNEINVRRRAVYAARARSNNQPLDVFARLTGERQVAKANDEGQCYLDDGGWKRPT